MYAHPGRLFADVARRADGCPKVFLKPRREPKRRTLSRCALDGDLSVRAGHTIAHAVKDALIASAPHRISDVTVHVEPMA